MGRWMSDWEKEGRAHAQSLHNASVHAATLVREGAERRADANADARKRRGVVAVMVETGLGQAPDVFPEVANVRERLIDGIVEVIQQIEREG